MKKLSRILAVVLSAVLIVTGIILVSGAADSAFTETTELETGFVYQHVTSYTLDAKNNVTSRTTEQRVSTDLQVVLAFAAPNSTIYLNNPNNDVFIYEMPTTVAIGHDGKPYTTGANVRVGHTFSRDFDEYDDAKQGNVNYYNLGGPLTLDLLGNQLLMVQYNHHSIFETASNNAFTVQNGEIRVGRADKTVYNKDAVDVFESFDGKLVTSQNGGDHTITMSQATYTYSSYGSNKTTTVTLTQDPLKETTLSGWLNQNIEYGDEITVTVPSGTDNDNVTYEVIQINTASAAPLFRTNWGGARLVLRNVNTYSAGVVYSAGESASAIEVQVFGGNHYVVTPVIDVNVAEIGGKNFYGAFVESKSNMLFTATDATIYVDKDCTLIASASFAKGQNQLYKSYSSFDFRGCNVIADYINTNLVKYANHNTNIRFQNCSIYGSINPSLMPGDDTYTDPVADNAPMTVATADDILFANGTRWATTGKSFDGSNNDYNVTLVSTGRGEAIVGASGSTSQTVTATSGTVDYAVGSREYSGTFSAAATVANYYGFKEIWEQDNTVTFITTNGASATIVATYPRPIVNGTNGSIITISESLSLTGLPVDNDVTSGNSANYITTGESTVTFDKQVHLDNAFQILDKNGNTYNDGNGFTGFYEYGTDVSVALAKVPTGGTLKFLCDIETVGVPAPECSCTDPACDKDHVKLKGKQYIGKITTEMTVDLDGHTWNIQQVTGDGGINDYEQRVGITTTKPVVIKNGIIGVKNVQTKERSYSPFVSEGTVIDITFEDITAYTGALVFVWKGNGSKITINGGEHYAVYHNTGAVGNGYISLRDNATVVANDALFYVGEDFASVPRLLSTSNTSTADGVPRAIDVTFNNCDIICSTIDRNVTSVNPDQMFDKISADTSVYFNDCRIFGSMDSTSPYDNAKDLPIDRNSIRFGMGTVFVSSQLRTDGVVVPTKGIFTNILDGEGNATTVTKTYTLHRLVGSDPIRYNYQSDPITFDITYDQTVDTKKVFELTTPNGETEYLEDEHTDGVLTKAYTFYNAIKHINSLDGDSGFILKFLGDYTIDGTNLEDAYNGGDTNSVYYASFKKGTTVDLNGYTFKMIKGTIETAGAQEKFELATTETVKFTHGTLIVTSDFSQLYPIFTVKSNFNDAKIHLENVDTFSGGIIYTFNSRVSVTVDGGEHVVYRNTKGIPLGSAFFVLRNTATLTANNAKFYTTHSSSGLLSTGSVYEDVAKSGSFTATFNGCDIIAHSVATNLIPNMNGATVVKFNGCNINGSIRPSVGSTHDTNFSPIKDYSVVMGRYNGTPSKWVTTGATFRSNILGTEEGYGITSTSVKSTYAAYVYASGANPHKNGWLPTRTAYSVTFDKTLAAGVPVTWYSYESTEPIVTTYVVVGEAAVPPSITLVDIVRGNSGNGWYYVDYAQGSWTTTPFTSDVASLNVSGATSFYPSVTVGSYLTAASYNLSLLGNISGNIILPIAANTPDGITLDSVVRGDVNGNITNVAVGSVIMQIADDPTDPESAYTDYLCYNVGSADAVSLSSNIYSFAKYTVNFGPGGEGGMTCQLTQRFKISPISYASIILGDEVTYDTAQGLIANMLRYSVELMEIAGKEDSATAELYAANSYKCTATREDSFTSDGAPLGDFSEISDALYSIQYVVDNYQLRLQIVLNDGYTLEGLSYEGWVTGSTEYNWDSGIEYNYTVNGNTVVTDNINVYNIDKMVTITVRNSSGTVKQGTYNMNNYYQYLKGLDQNVEPYTSFVLALREYGDTAAIFRFGPKSPKP